VGVEGAEAVRGSFLFQQLIGLVIRHSVDHVQKAEHVPVEMPQISSFLDAMATAERDRKAEGVPGRSF